MEQAQQPTQKKFKAKKQPPPPPSVGITGLVPNPFPITLEEEVTAAVIEWYTSKGLPVPQEDLEACKGIDAQQQAEFKKLAVAAEAIKPKPVYGTPEFWKDWWAKKRAKEAELKAAGLPIPEPKGASAGPKPKKKKSPPAS